MQRAHSRKQVCFSAHAGTINGMESPVTQPESPLEIVRRLENVVRLGTVAEVRYETPARCRIKTGDLVTDWLPWTTARAGGDRSWWAPEVGEQVIVLSPGGNTGAGVVFPAAYSDTHEQPGQREDVARVAFKDGVTIEYDRTVHVLRVSAPAMITLQTQGQIALGGNVHISGDLHVGGAVHIAKRAFARLGLWPIRPGVVPPMARSGADGGIKP